MRNFRKAICIGLVPIAACSLFVGPARAQDTQPTVYSKAIRYDGAGRVVGEILPDPDGEAGPPLRYAATRISYNALGLRVKVETGELANWQPTGVAPNAWPGFAVVQTEHFAYDTMSRLVRAWVVGSDGVTASVTQTNYDRAGREGCIAIRMNKAAFANPPANACHPGVAGDQGPDRITRKVYEKGRLWKVQQAYGVTTANGFPETLEQDYATYEYFPNGKMKSLTDARGYRAEMTYDAYDRQKRWVFPSKATAGTANQADYEEYGYDQNGNRTRLRKRDGRELVYNFDALNRMTSKIVPDGCAPLWSQKCPPADTTLDVYYAYDLRGLQTGARFGSQSGEGITNEYDGFGRLASSATNMGAVTRKLAYQYHPNGTRSELTYPDENGNPADDFKISFLYDRYDRMVGVRQGAIGSTVALADMDYNVQDELGALVRGGGNRTDWTYEAGSGRPSLIKDAFAGGLGNVDAGFAYNPASQIVARERSNDKYAWDQAENGNRAYVANGLNQYDSVNGAAFLHDPNGNLVDDSQSEYVYDAENRLVSATPKAGVTGTLPKGQLRYDPLGRLYETSGGSEPTRRFLYDGDELVAEYDIGGALVHRYVHGAGVDDPLVWYKVAAGTGPFYYHTDHQGSVVAFSGSDGVNLAIQTYDSWGYPGPSLSGRFAYTGQIFIPELNMYHYKARAYSPKLGRFLQTDPIGYEDQVNLYAYAGNDPVNRVDPDGKQSVPMIGSSYDTGSQIRAACQGDSGCERRLADQSAKTAIEIGAGELAGVGLVKLGAWAIRAFQGWRAEKVAAKGLTTAVRAAENAGPVAGGGAKIGNLSPGEIARIQNAANRSGANISVVGSKAAGKGKFSDFDYILEGGTSQSRSRIKNSLPSGPPGTGDGSGRDFLSGQIDLSRPYITFRPQ